MSAPTTAARAVAGDTGALDAPAKWTLKSGEFPAALAAKLTGVASKWHEFPAANAHLSMKEVHKKDSSGKVIWSGLEPWYAGLTINTPVAWQAPGAAPLPAPTAPRPRGRGRGYRAYDPASQRNARGMVGDRRLRSGRAERLRNELRGHEPGLGTARQARARILCELAQQERPLADAPAGRPPPSAARRRAPRLGRAARCRAGRSRAGRSPRALSAAHDPDAARAAHGAADPGRAGPRRRAERSGSDYAVPCTAAPSTPDRRR